MELTQKQKDFFEKLKETYQKEPLPSLDKIAKDFGFRHKNSVWQYFNKFKEAGLIKEVNGSFKINPSMFGAVLFASSVRAGFAQALDDFSDERISLDEVFEIDNPSTYLFKVSGDSMVDLGIYDGDTVIVKKCREAQSGDVVLACVDGEFTLKTYKKTKDDVWLEPANANYPNIRPKVSLSIFGKVMGLTRKIGI